MRAKKIFKNGGLQNMSMMDDAQSNLACEPLIYNIFDYT